MKKLIALAILLVILIAGAGLTTQLLSNNGGGLLPVLQIVGSPEASTAAVLPWKAEQLFLLIGFIITSLIGFALVLAALFWFLDRGIRQARVQAKADAEKSAMTRVETAKAS